MEEALKDKRFSHVFTNPRFRKLPKSERKVKIDKRFQSMFTDERFQVNYKVDERGRTLNQTHSDTLKKFYDLSDSDSDSDLSKTDNNSVTNPTVEDSSIHLETVDISTPRSESGAEILQDLSPEKSRVKEKLREAHRELNKYVDQVHKVKLNEKIRDKLSDISVDYARGYGTLLSDSDSSSDEPSSSDSEREEIEHTWGELDQDAERTQLTSSRLAVCNMDWDRISARDLMVLFHSFLPSNGRIDSITIYPSEFGLKRMAEEELKGPQELVERRLEDTQEEQPPEGGSYEMEKLREYQLKRLKYYYAVVVCDSVETANHLYTECDGLEYESSSTKLDLRFIPVEETFTQEARETCNSLPDLGKYKPAGFINKALQQGKVELTWDETEPGRVDLTRKVLAGEKLDLEQLAPYLASSSDEEEEDKMESASEEEGEEKREEDRIEKYRRLVSGLGDGKQQQKKKRGDVRLEVVWGGNNSPTHRTSSDESHVEESDQVITPTKVSKKKSREKQRPSDEDIHSDDEKMKRENELELLLAEDCDAAGVAEKKEHFNLKDLLKTHRKKKHLKKNKFPQVLEDTFKIDTSDERFSALFNSHHFNIDPADPHFRKTKAMSQLIAEKQKRRRLQDSF